MTRLDQVRAFRQHGSDLTLDCGGPLLHIRALSHAILRVRLATRGTLAPPRSWDPFTPDEAFAPVDTTFHVDGSHLVMRTAQMALRVERDPVRLSFMTPQGDPFCEDERGIWWREGHVGCAKQLRERERCFGFGQRTGPLDRRGREMRNWTTDPPWGHGPGTDPLYIASPAFLALRHGTAWGFILRNTFRSRFDMGSSNPSRWTVEADGGELDYYVVQGPAPADVLQGFAEVLGHAPVPPLWSLGYHQSRWSYETEERVRHVARELRRRQIPCDAIHLDIHHMDGYRVFTFSPERFPRPRRLCDDLAQEGFRTVAIVDPGVKVDPALDVYADGLAQGVYVRDAQGSPLQGYVWPDASLFPDFLRASVRAWWAGRQRALTDCGVGGIWNDMNEPTVFEKPFSEGISTPGTFPDNAVHGEGDERTTHEEVHNLYGLCMARASHQGLLMARPGERPFVLTRAAFAGVQRWSACWMGDNTSWWEHLAMTLPQLLNMGLSGVPFVGVDIGGFAGNATGELFARWMQLGAFLPFCRGHCAYDGQPHEPWAFGPRIEQIVRHFLGLRYRLLPYLVSLFHDAARDGIPVLRPLLLHDPNDEVAVAIDDQALLGPDLLLAPICRPGLEHRYVYLPAGTWFDAATGEAHAGPKHLLAHAPLERMPLFVRGGAILPLGPPRQFVHERPLDVLTLLVYPGDGDLTLFEDDGISPLDGVERSCSTRFTVRRRDRALLFAGARRQGGFVPTVRRLEVRLGAGHRSAGSLHDPDAGRVLFERVDDGSPFRVAFGLASI